MDYYIFSVSICNLINFILELFGFFIPQFSLSDWRMREGFIGLGAAFGIGLAGIIYAAVSRDLRDLKNKKMFYSLTVIVILGVVISTNIFPWDAIISLFDNLGN